MRPLLGAIALLLLTCSPAGACSCQAPVSPAVGQTYVGITVLLGGIPLLALIATFTWLLRQEP